MKDNKVWIVCTIWVLLTLNKFVKCDYSNEINNGNNSRKSKCSLVPDKDRMQRKLNKLIDNDNRMIKLSVVVKWDEYPANESYQDHMLWYMTTDDTGQRLLLLHDNFIVMSLGTLSYGIADMQVVFFQNPKNCLSSLSTEEADKLLKLTLLTFSNSSKATNEDGISILHVCTGSVNANGSCCNITLSGDTVMCYMLEEDVWLTRICTFITFLTLLIFLSWLNFIPLAANDDGIFETYTPLGDSESTFNITLKIKKNVGTSYKSLEKDGGWIKVTDLEVGISLLTFYNAVIDQMEYTNRDYGPEEYIIYSFKVRLDSVKIEHCYLVSESVSFLKLSHHLYKSFSDIFLHCKVRNADVLRHTCYGTFYGDIRWYSVFKKFTIVSIIMLSELPFILRIAFSFLYKDQSLSFTISVTVTVGLVTLFLVLFFTVLDRDKGFRKTVTDAVETLNEMHMQNTEKRIEKFISITLAPLSLGLIGLFCVPFSFLFGSIVLFVYSIPMLQFPFIFLNHLIDCKSLWWRCFIVITLSSVLYALTVWIIIIFVYCIVFYTQSFVFILIGVLINYKQVSDKAILTVLILVYAFDCLSRAYKKIENFNYKVIKVLYGLIDTFCKDHYGSPFDKVRMEHESKVTRINMRSREDKKFVSIVADAEGNPCLSTTGLFLYYKFQKQDKLPYMHVSERFLDELASVRSQLTPGSKYIILYEASKEVVSILVALVVVFLIISGFGRINDLSAGVSTFVTIGRSAAIMQLNKLIFQSNVCTLNDHDMHLKALVERHMLEFKDLWMNANFDILNVSHYTPHSGDIQTSFSSSDNLSRSSFHSDEDCDIIVELCEEEDGGQSDSLYIKRFFRK